MLGLVLIIAGTAALVSALLLFVLGYGVEGSSERHDGTGLGSLALIISFALLASGVFMIRTTRRRFAA